MIAITMSIFNSCSDAEMERMYKDPGKTSTATIENMYVGVLESTNQVVMPWYQRFFVTEQPTFGRYTHTMGWINSKEQYIPSSNSMQWRWSEFFSGTLAQFRELENLYANANEVERKNKRIFMLAAKIFFYDQSAQVVDIYNDIPWSEAGRIRNGIGIDAALPGYDTAEDIYTTILDDLKAIADELSTLTIEPYYQGLFTKKDYLNDGDLDVWKKYCNSLRLRLLIRVSDVMTNRAQAEIAQILGDPSTYPVITGNHDDVMLDAGGPDLYATTSSMTGGILQAMESWGEYDLAPKTLVDHMKNNADPRLEVVFDPNVEGEYIGLDPLLDESSQNILVANDLVARYDESTFMRNHYFPGFLITAAEVSFLKAEAFHKGYASGDAQEAYETGIRQSIDKYYDINATGDFRTPLDKPETTTIDNYINSQDISWGLASDKMEVLAYQKWINSGLGHMSLTWAELRRLDKPVLSFIPDNVSAQKAPPVRWLYPASEKGLNTENYNTVAAEDNLNSKVFWDVK